ncbi:GNAT family N-acetyltransferase [uncultured Nitratireductor sp.]|uniref:GNAT family N-acetyltransferase n=1 Tax=uncultured Nitratireductor sp. TaxID=520953 RepID=UPI0025D974AD|nr:GNAT family N-acetyltransferase [uncultured Nitratireductor sp.]
MLPTIRTASLDDASAITRIYAHAVADGTASYELEPPGEAEMRERMEALLRNGYPYIVAQEGDALLGYAYAGPFRPRRAYRFMVEDSVYLAPDAQGRGIGRILLDRLVEACAQRGFRQIVAVIGDGGEKSASVKLHRAVGFEDAGILRGSGYKHGRWLDTVFMQRTLNEGADAPPDPDSIPERLFRGEAVD